MEFHFPPTSASPTASASAVTVKHSPTSSISAAISCLKRSRRSEESTAPSISALKPATDRLSTFLEPLTECNALNEGYMAVSLSLLRILYGLSEFGNTLDDLVEPFPIVAAVSHAHNDSSVCSSIFSIHFLCYHPRRIISIVKSSQPKLRANCRMSSTFSLAIFPTGWFRPFLLVLSYSHSLCGRISSMFTTLIGRELSSTCRSVCTFSHNAFPVWRSYVVYFTL